MNDKVLNKAIDDIKGAENQYKATRKRLFPKMSTGEKIKHYRSMNNLTRKKLAEMSGVSEASINKYENGTRKPKAEQIRALADAMDLNEILFWDYTFDSPAKVMSLLFLLNESYQIDIQGQRLADGNLNPMSVSVTFNDLELDARLTAWETYKTAFEKVNPYEFNSEADFESVRATLKETYEKVKMILASSQSLLK